MIQFLHTLLLISLVCSSSLVFLASNPVYSILFLILTFCESASILILFKIEFLGLLYVIIYVGAITVLFLFVVMMLNVKGSSNSPFYTGIFLFVVSVIFGIQLFFSFQSTFFDFTIFKQFEISTFYLYFDTLYNIDVLAQVLYNNFLICFLLAGIILLVAMIGAIVLTLNFKSNRKNELSNRQLSRGITQLSYYN